MTPTTSAPNGSFANLTGGAATRKLDEFTYTQKLRHWMRNDPWNPEGTQLYCLNAKISRSAVQMSGGHIEKMPLLVGRPCFGIAPAFLRYKDHVRYSRARGVQPAGRCHSCKAREACESVVNRRLRSTASIKEAWIEWLQAGGPAAFRKPHFKQSPVSRLWARLCGQLVRNPFMSVNDSAVLDHYRDEDRERREKDAQRQAKKRTRDRREGNVDILDLALLEEAGNKRLACLVAATYHPECPQALFRIPLESVTELRDVWLGKEILRLQKRKPNAPSIARWIATTDRSNRSANHAALATRVAKDLKRICEFERIEWDGNVLLVPLDPSTELPLIQDEAIDDERRHNPLEILEA